MTDTLYTVHVDEPVVTHHSFRLTRDDLVNLIDDQKLEKLELNGGVSGVAKQIGSDPKSGLSAAELHNGVQQRIEMYGANRFPEPRHKNIFELFWEALADTTILVLVAAALTSIGLQEAFPTDEKPRSEGWYEGTAILMAVLTVAVVTAANNYSKEKQFRSLSKNELNKKVKVIRGGQPGEIQMFDLLVGDVVLLEPGDIIPADGLFLEGHELLVDESGMTGESDMVRRDEQSPWITSGCTVCDGMARVVVCCVGESSKWGQALAKLTQEHGETPLQRKLEAMAEQIGKLGLLMAVLTFLALAVNWAVRKYAIDSDSFSAKDLTELLTFFIIAVTIVVVAVPEGLPLAVTISLAYSMKKMMNDNNLVRRLQACETMGGATNICSDKTGTLTENRMTVMEGWIVGKNFSRDDDLLLADGPKALFMEAVSVNSTAYIQQEGGKKVPVGNRTECALLGFIENMGCNYFNIRSQTKTKRVYAFSSKNKRMSTIIELTASSYYHEPSSNHLPQYKYRIHTKGASEMVLGQCSTYLDEHGIKRDLDEKTRNMLFDVTKKMASRALRTICIAYKDLPDESPEWAATPPDDNLTCLALVGITDPVRAEVPDAVRTCQKAGIVVRMVTGDNVDTAMAIARECGILTDNEEGRVMEGHEFRSLSSTALKKRLPKLQVLARSLPTDKYTLVHTLKEMGEVVAVTGDGANDAPALNEAHVGLAMGLNGSDIAKKASDIIILDDNFSSIVKSVMWGRCVFDNIRKFLQFQLTVNLVALIIAFVAAVSGKGTPLATIQLLWVNLIMDTMAALALATEQPTPDLLKRPPYGMHAPLISEVMIRNIVCHTVFQVGLVLSLLYAGEYLFKEINGEDIDEKEFYTFIFNTFVFLQVFNEFNARKVNEDVNVYNGLLGNYLFLGVIVITIVGQVLIVEFGGSFISTTGLDWKEWLLSVGFAAITIPYGFMVRLISAKKFLVCFRGMQPLLESGGDDEDEENEKKSLINKESKQGTAVTST